MNERNRQVIMTQNSNFNQINYLDESLENENEATAWITL